MAKRNKEMFAIRVSPGFKNRLLALVEYLDDNSPGAVSVTQSDAVELAIDEALKRRKITVPKVISPNKGSESVTEEGGE
jgi:hypothetical protein